MHKAMFEIMLLLKTNHIKKLHHHFACTSRQWHWRTRCV